MQGLDNNGCFPGTLRLLSIQDYSNFSRFISNFSLSGNNNYYNKVNNEYNALISAKRWLTLIMQATSAIFVGRRFYWTEYNNLRGNMMKNVSFILDSQSDIWFAYLLG